MPNEITAFDIRHGEKRYPFDNLTMDNPFPVAINAKHVIAVVPDILTHKFEKENIHPIA